MDAKAENPYPPPPPGYQPPEPFQYPTLWLQIGAVVILVISAFLLFIITIILQSLSKDGVSLLSSRNCDLVIVIFTIIGTLVVHELIHGAVYSLMGYRVRYGISPRHLAAYAGVFGQWQERDHNILAALATLVILTIIIFPLLAVPNQVIVLVAFTVLLVNTAGAVGDLYLSWRLLRMPRLTLGYDIDPQTMLTYKPLENQPS